MAVAQSFGVLNYSGALFAKGNQATPLSTAIGGRAKITNHVEFVTGQEYNIGGGTQPSISETASLTAPQPTSVTRTQNTNVTQIFQEAVGVSYGKMSNMGTLSGVNIANQQANPMSELDFQVGARLKKVANDIEYTFIQGVYNKAANDATANQTCGIHNAITTSVLDAQGKECGLWVVSEAAKLIDDQHAPIDSLTLLCDATTMFQISADARKNGFTVVPASRTENGIAVTTIVTPLGVSINLMKGVYIPANTAYLLNLGVMAPVYQPVPGKGNFFLEQLAKTGAGETYQLFGQIGLDYGPEWYHAKITNLASTYTTEPVYNVKTVAST